MAELNEEEHQNVKSLSLRSSQLVMLGNTNLYVDDTIIEAANILLRESFKEVRGFEDTLFRQKPQLRTRYHPTAANIFHMGKVGHFVCTIYTSPNRVVYIWTL